MSTVKVDTINEVATNGNIAITNTGNGNTVITPAGSGKVILDGIDWPTAGSGTAGQVLELSDSDTLAFATSGGFTLGTERATTSGSATTFTGIPDGVTMIVINFDLVSSNGTGNWTMTLGDEDGLDTSGYIATVDGAHSSTRHNIGDANLTSAFVIAWTTGMVAAETFHGAITLTKFGVRAGASDAHTWCLSGALASDNSGFWTMGGSMSMAKRITQLSIISANTLDLGAVNIMYQ